MKNTFKSWSETELQILDGMMRDNYSWKDIAKTLGRTENAVRNAFRNIVYHQLLVHEPSAIAKKYHITVDDLHESIVHPKYAIAEPTPFPWKTLLTFLTLGGAYYAHLLCKNWH